MRTAFNDKQISRDDDGLFVGINLGYDYCAEHEWGIDDLKRKFGLPELTRKTAGVKSMQTQELPELHTTNRSIICYKSTWETHNPFPPDSEELFTAWDGGSFAIRVGKNDKDVIHDLVNAFKTRDVLLFLSGSTNPFAGSGLSLCIASRMPDEWKEFAKASHLDRFDLEDAMAKTGIEKKLKKAKRGYYALRPEWADEDEDTLRFWLNPHDQHIYKSGWYSVEDLEQWAEGTGPIIKEKA